MDKADIELVRNYHESVENIKRFLEDLETEQLLSGKLSQFRHWYYIPELDILGPSKFIGYRQMNATKYIALMPITMDGRDTVHHLKRWFRPASADESDLIKEKLEDLCQQYNKVPNKRLYFHWPK